MLQTPTKKKASERLWDCLSNETPRPVSELQSLPVPCCWAVTNVLTPSECRAVIERAEAQGFEPALLNVGGGQQILATDIRNSDRTIIDDEKFAQMLFERIRPFLPKQSSSLMAGLNERMRILRYQPGHVFHPHMDGCYEHPDGAQISRYTLMIYLNEGFEGGSTVFHNTLDTVDFVPQTGSVLMFAHHLLHEGQELRKGTKYAIRTDVMFRIEYKQKHLY